MNIMTPNGKPLINGDIMPKDFIHWSPLGAGDKKRRKNFDQTNDHNKCNDLRLTRGKNKA
jgi:hypothetical protein